MLPRTARSSARLTPQSKAKKAHESNVQSCVKRAFSRTLFRFGEKLEFAQNSFDSARAKLSGALASFQSFSQLPFKLK
jgi:hypothetical protein